MSSVPDATAAGPSSISFGMKREFLPTAGFGIFFTKVAVFLTCRAETREACREALSSGKTRDASESDGEILQR